MEEQIRKMHYKDSSLMIIFNFFLWVILIYTMTVVSNLASTASFRLFALTIGITAGLAVTTASIAVLTHLKRNRNEIYSEDIMNSQIIEENK